MSADGKSTEAAQVTEHQKVWLELAKLSLASFQHRREYEWKVAFGLWIAIGLFTYFIVKEGAYIDREWLRWGYVFSAFVWFVCWQLPMRRGFDLDQEFKQYYMALAAGEERKKPDLNDFPLQGPLYAKCGGGPRGPRLAWLAGQTLVTVVFLVGSFLIITDSEQRAVNAAEKKVPAILQPSEKPNPLPNTLP